MARRWVDTTRRGGMIHSETFDARLEGEGEDGFGRVWTGFVWISRRDSDGRAEEWRDRNYRSNS